MKYYLSPEQTPKEYYNIQADLTNRPLPPLHPGTKQPVGPADLAPLFPMELIKQEVSTERFIEIPEPVQEVYQLYRSTPLVRATRLEKALNTTAHIYYKYEGVSPSGSHKTNTAIAQAYYNKQEGIKKIVTETGAGQWGTALSFACAQFGLECEVFMVRGSYDQKPYRKAIMETFGATVHPSPSNLTQVGRDLLQKDPDMLGSLGIAISEAVEVAIQDEKTHYALGSVLNHVLLHQTVIGQEAMLQFEMAGEYPDVVIAPLGGGSNFAGIAFPFIGEMLRGGKKIRAVAVEPALECFQAGLTFAKAEGIMPAPEATHALAQVFREAEEAKLNGDNRVILFNLCGHGHFDMSAYVDYMQGKLQDHVLDEDVLKKSVAAVAAI